MTTGVIENSKRSSDEQYKKYVNTCLENIVANKAKDLARIITDLDNEDNIYDEEHLFIEFDNYERLLRIGKTLLGW